MSHQGFTGNTIKMVLFGLLVHAVLVVAVLVCAFLNLHDSPEATTIIALDRRILDSARKPESLVPYRSDEELMVRRTRELVTRSLDEQSEDRESIDRLIRSTVSSCKELELRPNAIGADRDPSAITSYMEASRQVLESSKTARSNVNLWLVCCAVLLTGLYGAGLVVVVRSAGGAKLENGDETGSNSPALPEALEQLAASMTGSVTFGGKAAKNYLDNMPVGLITADERGLVRTVNYMALKLLRAPADAVVGKDIGSIFLIEGREHSLDLESLQDVALNKIVELKLQPFSPGAKPVPVDVSFVEFSGLGGKGFIANLLDVSDRYEVERLKEDFVSMVSHDLRTPLSFISIFVSGLVRSLDSLSLSENQKKMAVAADEQVHRLMRLVNSLLDIARVRSGKFELQRRSVELEPLLQKVEQAMSAIAARSNVSLAINSISDFIVADEDRIYQVLENLTANAIKFSPAGGVVKIRAVKMLSGIKFEVEDFGAGIPVEEQGRIFERFEQVSPDNSPAREGTGLGLAICKVIVEQHGGVIGVVSTPGSGSCFWFELPD